MNQNFPNLDGKPGSSQTEYLNMADACAKEWKSIFQKSLGKLSSKCYRSFLLDIVAIFLGLKPSLLFDCAVVEWKNAIRLIAGLATKTSSFTDFSPLLYVLKVDEDIFYADLRLLVKRLRESVDMEEFTLIDISGKLHEPRILEKELADSVKRQFHRIVEDLEENFKDFKQRGELVVPDSRVINLRNYGDDNWCVPSIFGFLLGYPMIYWCDRAGDLDNCLSMVPLNRYTLTFKVAPSALHARLPASYYNLVESGCEEKDSFNHTLFSFTAPVALECYYKSKVSNWFKRICEAGETFGITEHLAIQKTTVTFSQVTL